MVYAEVISQITEVVTKFHNAWDTIISSIDVELHLAKGGERL